MPDLDHRAKLITPSHCGPQPPSYDSQSGRYYRARDLVVAHDQVQEIFSKPAEVADDDFAALMAQSQSKAAYLERVRQQFAIVGR